MLRHNDLVLCLPRSEMYTAREDQTHPFCQTCHQHNIKYKPCVYKRRLLLKSFTFAPTLVNHKRCSGLCRCCMSALKASCETTTKRKLCQTHKLCNFLSPILLISKRHFYQKGFQVEYKDLISIKDWRSAWCSCSRWRLKKNKTHNYRMKKIEKWSSVNLIQWFPGMYYV